MQRKLNIDTFSPALLKIEDNNRFTKGIALSYRRIIDSFDPILSSVGKKYFEEHETNNIDLHPLATSIAVMISEPFGSFDRATIHQAAIANLCFDHFTHLVDDATDERNENASLSIHLSNHLLTKGLRYSMDLCKNYRDYYQRWEKYMDYAFDGERYLWRHHKKLESYEERDFEMLAKRGSLVKVCAAIFAELSGKWELLDNVEKGLDNLSVALQLVDDLVDWKCDLNNSIYNYPIVLACKAISESVPNYINKDIYEEEIFSPPGCCSHLKKSNVPSRRRKKMF